jgi:hypothetical protein
MRIIVTETTQRHGKFHAHLEGGTKLKDMCGPVRMMSGGPILLHAHFARPLVRGPR